jgi:hypothetical protein
VRIDSNSLATCAVLFIAALSADKTASAARLLTATVQWDGRRVLQTAYSDDGTAPPEIVWRYLARETRLGR